MIEQLLQTKMSSAKAKLMRKSIRWCMSAIALFAMFLASSTVSVAQIQRLISYQGLLTQPSGLPISDGQYGVVLRLYDAPVGGNLVYEETQQTQVVKGLFNVLIGQNIGLNAVDIYNNQYWLETALESQPPFPRTRLAVVPYAIRAEWAVKAGAFDDDALGVVRSVNTGQGVLVVHGNSGVSVTTSGDTIHIESTIVITGVQAITSPQNSLLVTNSNGPNTSIDVRDGGISTQKLADGSITNQKISNSAVGTIAVANGAITLAKIAPGVIPTTLPPSGPASGNLTGNYPSPAIANSAVTSARLSDNAASSSKIADGSVTSLKISDGAVSTTKLSNNSVTSDKLSLTGVVAGTFGSETLIPQISVDDKGRVNIIGVKSLGDFPWNVPAGGELTGTYPNPTIIPNAVTTAKLLDASVTSPKLATASVVSTKLASNSVTGDKVLDGSLGAIDLAPGTIPTTLPPTGPAGGDLSGLYPSPIVLNGAVGNAKIANLAVDAVKLADNSVTSIKILDGTIVLADLQAGLIPTVFTPSGPAGGDLTGNYPSPLIQNGVVVGTKLAPNAIDATKLADIAVNSAKILDGTIVLADLAPGVIPTTLPPNGPAGGALAGTYPNPTIAISAGNNLLTAINDGATGVTIADNRLNTTGVLPGTYGSGTLGIIPRFTVDVYGRVSSVIEQPIMSAQPSGPAGGDLTGTYPNPMLSSSAGAGNRIVDAVRADYLFGDPDINTPNNLVVLTATNHLPASDGSLLIGLSAGAVDVGVLPVARGGTSSGTPLVGNRVIVSNVGTIVEGPAIGSGQLLIGTGALSAPLVGSILAGPGIAVAYIAPNVMISRTDARVEAGTANDQTNRWDSGLASWLRNTNLFASATGNLTSLGNLTVNGTTDLIGTADIGSNAGSASTIGKGAASFVNIGTSNSSVAIRGTTNINTNVDANVNIGNGASANSSTAISVGNSGSLTLIGIAHETPLAFLTLNGDRQMRHNPVATMALEGMQFQSGVFRLGGNNTTINPILNQRYINIHNQQLSFTSVNGTRTLYTIQGGAGTQSIVGFVGINATGTDTTRIGSPTSRTTIGGELDARGFLRNQTGPVVILDQFEAQGQTQLNVGTEENTEIGRASSLGDQSIRVAVGQGVAGWMSLLNIKPDATPLELLSLDAGNRVRRTGISGLANEGLYYQNGAIRLGSPNTNNNPFLQNRFVSLNASRLTFNRSGGTQPMMWLDAAANDIFIRGTTRINLAGSQSTYIGNPLSSTRIAGTLDVAGPTVINNTLNVNGAFGLLGNLDVGGATTLNNTLDVDGATTLNNTLDVDGATTLNNSLDVDGGTTLNSTLDVDGATTLNNTLYVRSNQTGWVTTIENTNGNNGDGMLIKLGRTHGAWNGSAYIQIANPASILAGSTLTTVRGWLNGASFSVTDLWTIFPGAAIAGALASVTNTIIDKINTGLGLPLQFFPQVTVIPAINIVIPDVPQIKFDGACFEIIPGGCCCDIGFGEVCIDPVEICTPTITIFPGIVLPDINIPVVRVGPYSMPRIPSIPTTGLPSIAIPDFRGSSVSNSLTRENHYITFQDKAGRQTGAIKAESVSDWRDNTVLDDVYLTGFAASWIGIDLLGAAVSGFTEIVNLVASYNVIGVAYESGNGDYAEWLERENSNERVSPGDVVGVRGGKISKQISGAEQVMVVSHKPIVLGNMPAAELRYLGNDVAFRGQVPVKVMGSVASGDFIVAKGSVRGYAVAIHPSEMTPEDHELVVGRSWQVDSRSGPKMVNTVIGVNSGAWVNHVSGLEKTQTLTERRINSLENQLREKLGINISDNEVADRP